MDEYAPEPQEMPLNSARLPLDPVDLGGVKFYGWKIVPTKKVDTGKKDKSGNEKIAEQIDESGTPIYDKTTSLMKAGKLNDPVIAKMAISNARNTDTISKLMQQVAQLQLAVKKSNGGK